ncbi:MAG: zinc ribbon domain-containing protein [Lachnospiraceae bacterium]|nr:zinc ribbon domain-containing protein [Lachnospiraceae bacterium]
MSKDVKSFLNAKNVIRLVGILLIILFFVPSFLVSCTYSGDDVTSYKLSTFKMLTGVTIEGEQFLKPAIGAIIFLLLPVAILVITFLKKYLSNMIMSIVITACSAVDFIAWLVLSSKVKAGAAEIYCESKPMFGFVLNLLLLLVVLAGGILSLLQIIDLDKCFMEPGYLSAAKKPTAFGANGAAQSATPVVCNSCGAVIPAGNKFCNSCGAPAPEAGPTPAAETVCANCGAVIPAGNKFCNSCGTPVSAPEATSETAPAANTESVPSENTEA